jgi:multicomponent K+:H+ antiporter subunit D
MRHLVILPVLLPLVAGCLLLLAANRALAVHRVIGIAASLALVPVAVLLLVAVHDGSYHVYALGDWAPPFGIMLVADRLSALMVLLTAVVASASVVYATTADDADGRHFHAFFQFQVLGINGAFLTGDLFNLFVFFEILLIASYALLLHGHGAARVRAAVHVVVLNLIASALFLFAVGVLYSVAGTLNLADLARVAPSLEGGAVPLARVGALLLLVVFALKAAILPLSFWLPPSYAASKAAVAALFAVLTKVGVYAILRIYPLVFGDDAGPLAQVAVPWVLPAALATVAFGALGVLSARSLRDTAAWLVLYSVGTLMVAVGLFSERGYAAAVFYTVHSTLASAALFLVADLVTRQRPVAADSLSAREPVLQPAMLGTLFVVGAVAMAGLPPLTGFAGKVMILGAAGERDGAWLTWSVLLGASLVVIVGLARAGSSIFWRGADAAPRGAPASSAGAWASASLLASLVLMVGFGAATTGFALAAGRQLATPADYVAAVLGADATRADVRRPLR